jgi:UDP:flavonoid glycosyltransferase YjiC (YdhE family)
VRVALVAEGTRGDVFPMLALATRVRGAGHSVLLCAPPDFAGDAELRELPFRAVGRSVRDYLERNAHALSGRSLRMVREVHRYSRESLLAQAHALPDALAGADLVVAGGVAFAAASVAELLGIPYRYVAYCPVVLPSSVHPPVTVSRQTFSPRVNRLLWRALVPLYDVSLGPPLNRARAALGLRPVRRLIHHVLGERPLLAADAALAPAPDDTHVPVGQIPALHPHRPEPLPEKLEHFLASGPAPVFVGFGSMTDADARATTELVLGAVADLGCRAIVGSGWAGLGDVPLPPGVTVVGTVDHASLFARVAAVVHHGGAGTTTTAARAGAPQLLVPHVLDQFWWAHRVERLGLGPRALPRRRLTRARLRAALAPLLETDVFAERAGDLGARLRRDLALAPDPADVLLR